MKDLILPKNNQKDQINIVKIIPSFKGIIIAYKDNKPVQFIIDNDGEWSSSDTIDISIMYEGRVENSLIELCNVLINDGIADSFKVIEFEK